MVPRGAANTGANRLTWYHYNFMADRLHEITRHQTWNDPIKTWSGILKPEKDSPAYVDIVTSRAFIYHNGPRVVPKVVTDPEPETGSGDRRRRHRRSSVTTKPTTALQKRAPVELKMLIPGFRWVARTADSMVQKQLLALVIQMACNQLVGTPETTLWPSFNLQYADPTNGNLVPKAILQIISTGAPLPQTVIMAFIGKLNKMQSKENWGTVYGRPGDTNVLYGTIQDKEKNVLARWALGDTVHNLQVACAYTPKVGVLGKVATFFGCANVHVEL